MGMDNVIFQDLESFRKGSVFKMAVEELSKWLWRSFQNGHRKV